MLRRTSHETNGHQTERSQLEAYRGAQGDAVETKPFGQITSHTILRRHCKRYYYYSALREVRHERAASTNRTD